MNSNHIKSTSISSQERKKIFSDSKTLFLRSIVVKINGLISNTFLSFYLGPEKLGILKLIDVIPAFGKYINLGYDSYILRNVNKVRTKEGIQNNELYKTSRAGSLIFSSLILLLVLPIFYFIHPKEYYLLITIANIAAIAFIFVRNFSNNVQLIEDFRYIGFWEIISSFFQIAIILCSVWFIGLYAPLIAILCSYLILIYAMYKRSDIPLKFSFDKKSHKRQLKLSLPLAIGTLLFGLELVIERYTVSFFLSNEILGNYFLVLLVYGGFGTLLNNILRASSVKIYQKSSSLREAREIFPFLIETSLSLAFIILITSAGIIEIINYLFYDFFGEYGLFLEANHVIVLVAVISTSQLYFVHSLTSSGLNRQLIVIIARLSSILFFVSILYLNQNINFINLIYLKSYTIALFGFISFLAYFWTLKIKFQSMIFSILLLLVPILLSLNYSIFYYDPLIKISVIFITLFISTLWFKNKNRVSAYFYKHEKTI